MSTTFPLSLEPGAVVLSQGEPFNIGRVEAVLPDDMVRVKWRNLGCDEIADEATSDITLTPCTVRVSPGSLVAGSGYCSGRRDYLNDDRVFGVIESDQRGVKVDAYGPEPQTYVPEFFVLTGAAIFSLDFPARLAAGSEVLYRKGRYGGEVVSVDETDDGLMADVKWSSDSVPTTVPLADLVLTGKTVLQPV